LNSPQETANQYSIQNNLACSQNLRAGKSRPSFANVNALRMKIGILISGRGSNMVALVEAAQSSAIADSEISVVISDRRDAIGLQKAQERGVETLVIERAGRKRSAHDAEIVAELRRRGVELVCLAGYLRLLSPDFVHAFPNRIVNIHPSLLPAFPGLNAQRQAFEYGVKFTGCTVHFVDENLDSGAIVAQKAVPIFDDDTIETLTERILIEEHKLYAAAVAQIVRGNYRIDGRRVILLNP
jgi:phosphoribosylglycinamide formyltransferase-1